MSSPRILTFALFRVGPTRTRPPRRSTTSWGYTVSAPCGIGAPVMIRTACPEARRPSNTVPAGSSATTSRSRVPAAGTSPLATAYPSPAELSVGGQTIGKMIVGVKVAAAAGEPPPLGTALLRYLAYFASAGIFTLGFVMAGLRHDKRALHDLIAGTRVERLPRAAPPAPAEPPP